MTVSPADRPKRPYLRPAERRRHLLDAAAAVVRREGLNGLTMVAVTAEAGVSRRLVYNHFPDLRTLVGAYVVDRLSPYVQESETTFQEHGANPLKLAREVFRRLAQIAPEDRQLLRALLNGAVPRELFPVRAAVEQAIVERWVRVLPGDGPTPFDAARLLILAQMALSLADFIDRGDVADEEAEALVKEASKLVPNALS